MDFVERITEAVGLILMKKMWTNIELKRKQSVGDHRSFKSISLTSYFVHFLFYSRVIHEVMIIFDVILDHNETKFIQFSSMLISMFFFVLFHFSVDSDYIVVKELFVVGFFSPCIGIF